MRFVDGGKDDSKEVAVGRDEEGLGVEGERGARRTHSALKSQWTW